MTDKWDKEIDTLVVGSGAGGLLAALVAAVTPKVVAFEPGAELPRPYPNPSLRIDPVTRDVALARFGLSLDRPVLALCPGAEFGESKRWPAEHFGKVAELKIREGWQVWLFGSKNDHPVGEEILARLIPGLREEAVNLAGETSLAEAIDLLSCADAVVSNDSGLMHVSAALGRPLAAVYGSTSPAFTPPLSEQVTYLRPGQPVSRLPERVEDLVIVAAAHAPLEEVLHGSRAVVPDSQRRPGVLAVHQRLAIEQGVDQREAMDIGRCTPQHCPG